MKTTLKDLIDDGTFSLDDEVNYHSMDPRGMPDEVTIDEPERHAKERFLEVGDTFDLLEGLWLSLPRRYRVTSAPDPETGEGEYAVERIDASVKPRAARPRGGGS
ncbi:MAG: hypothetical protein D6701_06145 [Gemmatimonadetes bacterium]|nr:MAG: hypothetical protein D6701_06145 [Gemmatimonadota bacterium]